MSKHMLLCYEMALARSGTAAICGRAPEFDGQLGSGMRNR